MGLSIVIPSWNGSTLLQRHLPSVVKAACRYSRETGNPWELLVVDDGSRDDTVAVISREFPQVRIIRKDVNSGFSSACNTGFQACRMPLVALLNNDVTVDEGYFCSAIPHFQDQQTFAVTAKVYEYDTGVFSTGGKVGRFRRGFWSVYFNYDVPESGFKGQPEKALFSMYAVGGFATYDRQKLLDLGGFCELLSPFHWEDIDLSYRAWKRGWTTDYEPNCMAFHEISATIDSHYSKRNVEITAVRNRLLFHWINLHSYLFLASHAFSLFLLILTRVFAGDLGFYRSLLQALRVLPEASRLRREEKSRTTMSDEAVASLLNNFYKTAPIHVYYSREQILSQHREMAPRNRSSDARRDS